MDRKLKYITFHIKHCDKAYEYRTCSPYIYPKCSKWTVSVKRVKCKYQKIITKHCRINDIQKFINTDSSFPINSTGYINILIQVTEDSTSFFDSISMMSGNNDNQRLLRLAFHSIESSYPVVERLLYNELENIYSVHIKDQAKILKFNLIICIHVLQQIYDIGDEYWIDTHAVENLENYTNHLTTTCNFIYMIILKKRSTVVKKMLPVISYEEPNIYLCALCEQPEEVCTCFAHLGNTSNNNQNNLHYSLPEPVKKVENIEDVPHCSKTTAYDRKKDAGYWNGPFQNYSDSQGSDTD